MKVILTAFLILALASIQSNAQMYQTWVQRINGSNNDYDQGSSIAVDGQGNVYLTGWVINNSQSIENCITVKYNSRGTLQWEKIYPGDNSHEGAGSSIAVDAAGNIYVAGQTTINETGLDVLTIKYNQSGTQQWLRTYDQGGDEWATSIAIDQNGNVYVTGARTLSDNDWDYLTIKYNSSGVQQWVKTYDSGDNRRDQAKSIALDNSGSNVYVTGLSTKNLSGYDYATIKYKASDGTFQWAARYNGSYNDYDAGYSVAVGDDGNIYVTGRSTEQSDEGVFQSITTIKYNSSGTQQWVKNYYTIANTFAEGKSIATFSGDNSVYVTGTTASAGTGPDFTTIKYNSSGDQQWLARQDGSSLNDKAFAMTLDVNGNAYVTGYITQSNGWGDYATIGYRGSDGRRLWMKTYNGTANNEDIALSIAVHLSEEGPLTVFITGRSYGVSTGPDITTVGYSNLVWLMQPGTSENLNAVSFSNSDTAYSVGNKGTILFTSDGGINWSTQSSGTTAKLNGLSFVNSTTGTAVGDSGKILHTTNGGINWSSQLSPTLLNLLSVHFINASIGTAVGAYGTILRTTDGGNIWLYHVSGTTNALNSVFLANPSEGFAAGNSGTILHTTDRGLTWQRQTSGTSNNLNGIYLLTSSEGYAVGDSGTILKTTNTGANWTDISAGELTNYKAVCFVDASNGFIAGDSSTVLTTTDGGSSWEHQLTDDASNSNLRGISYADNNTGIAVGESGSLFVTTLGESIYTLSDPTALRGPTGSEGKLYRFALEKNYPNPFNPKTEIKYQVGKYGLVKISVYDILGRLESELVNEIKNPGSYSIEFDGTNLSCGAYFCKMEAGNFTQTRKMLLVK